MRGISKIAMFAISMCVCMAAQAMPQCNFSCISQVLDYQPDPGQNEIHLTYDDLNLTHLNRELDWINDSNNKYYYNAVAVDYPQIFNGYHDGSLKQQLYYAEKDHTKQVVIPNWMMKNLSEVSKKYNYARDRKGSSKDLYISEPPLIFGNYVYFIDKYGPQRAKILQTIEDTVYFDRPWGTQITNYYSLKSFIDWDIRQKDHNLSAFISLLKSNYKDGYLLRLIELVQTHPGSSIVTLSKENIDFEALNIELNKIIDQDRDCLYLYPNIFAIEYGDSLQDQLEQIRYGDRAGDQVILDQEILDELGDMVKRGILVDSEI